MDEQVEAQRTYDALQRIHKIDRLTIDCIPQLRSDLEIIESSVELLPSEWLSSESLDVLADHALDIISSHLAAKQDTQENLPANDRAVLSTIFHILTCYLLKSTSLSILSRHSFLALFEKLQECAVFTASELMFVLAFGATMNDKSSKDKFIWRVFKDAAGSSTSHEGLLMIAFHMFISARESRIWSCLRTLLKAVENLESSQRIWKWMPLLEDTVHALEEINYFWSTSPFNRIEKIWDSIDNNKPSAISQYTLLLMTMLYFNQERLTFPAHLRHSLLLKKMLKKVVNILETKPQSTTDPVLLVILSELHNQNPERFVSFTNQQQLNILQVFTRCLLREPCFFGDIKHHLEDETIAAASFLNIVSKFLTDFIFRCVSNDPESLKSIHTILSPVVSFTNEVVLNEKADISKKMRSLYVFAWYGILQGFVLKLEYIHGSLTWKLINRNSVLYQDALIQLLDTCLKLQEALFKLYLTDQETEKGKSWKLFSTSIEKIAEFILNDRLNQGKIQEKIVYPWLMVLKTNAPNTPNDPKTYFHAQWLRMVVPCMNANVFDLFHDIVRDVLFKNAQEKDSCVLAVDCLKQMMGTDFEYFISTNETNTTELKDIRLLRWMRFLFTEWKQGVELKASVWRTIHKNLAYLLINDIQYHISPKEILNSIQEIVLEQLKAPLDSNEKTLKLKNDIEKKIIQHAPNLELVTLEQQVKRPLLLLWADQMMFIPLEHLNSVLIPLESFLRYGSLHLEKSTFSKNAWLTPTLLKELLDRIIDNRVDPIKENRLVQWYHTLKEDYVKSLKDVPNHIASSSDLKHKL